MPAWWSPWKGTLGREDVVVGQRPRPAEAGAETDPAGGSDAGHPEEPSP